MDKETSMKQGWDLVLKLFGKPSYRFMCNRCPIKKNYSTSINIVTYTLRVCVSHFLLHFAGEGMSVVVDQIFSYLDVDWLDTELVLSDKLKPIFASCNFWKKQLMKKVSNPLPIILKILITPD